MNKPIPVSKEELVKILKDITTLVEAGDSLEGSLEYMMPFDEDDDLIEDADFVVRAAYRLGNLQGQGGMRLIGKMER